MMINIKLPKEIRVSDYHEFDEIKDNIKLVISGLKVKGIGYVRGYYIGMIYSGKLTNTKNKKLYIQIKKVVKKYEFYEELEKA